MARPRRPRDPADPLQVLPGIGPSLADDLRSLDIRTVDDLRTANPEELYARLCLQTGQRQDPCVLYVFRCAAYCARTPDPDPELRKWWNWKGREL